MPDMENTVNNQESEPNKPKPLASYECRQRWSQLIQAKDYQPVIEEVMNQEWPKYVKNHALDAENRLSHISECILILASAPSIFAAAVQGDLVQRMKSDTTLKKEYENIGKRADKQPSISIQLLADENGIAPTPNQYNDIRGLVLEYCVKVSHEDAWKIDNITGESVSKEESQNGHRKYYQPKKGKTKENHALKHLFSGMTQRYRETPPELRDTPFKFPPGECCYSENSHLRQSSNSALNLVEDICTYLHNEGKLKQHFRMHPFTIYLILQPKEAAIAEIFCSGLLQLWIQNGGGFNYYPAGRKVSF